MEELTFMNDGDFIRLTADVENDSLLPSCGDARIFVRVKSADFEAKNDVWAHRDVFAAFCQALVNLERSRRGVARLVSISPGELDISIQAVSPLGAMAVSGVCGYSVYRPHGNVFHRLEFGFEFDPSQLVAAVSIPWVRRHAA